MRGRLEDVGWRLASSSMGLISSSSGGGAVAAFRLPTVREREERDAGKRIEKELGKKERKLHFKI